MKTIIFTKEEMKILFKDTFEHKNPTEISGIFFKVNGEKREFVGVLNYKDKNVKGIGKSNSDTFKDTDAVSYFDTDKKGWRRFKLDRLDTIHFKGSAGVNVVYKAKGD